MIKRMVLIGLIALTLSTGLLSFVQMPKADAMTTYGRGLKCGYFGGACNDPCINRYTCDEVLPNGIPAWVNSPDTLTTFLRDTKNSGNEQERKGASFVVNTMLGYNAPGAGWPVGDNHINELNKRLKNPHIQINWDNDDFSYRYNSTYGITYGDDFFYDELKTKKTNDVIGVYYDGTLVYALRRACANPLGDNNWPTPIPEYNPQWNLTGWSFVSNETTAPGQLGTSTSAYPGERVMWRNDIRNLSQGTTSYFEYGPRRQVNGGTITAPLPNTGAVFAPGDWSGFKYDDMIVPNTTGQVCEWMQFQPWSSWDGGANRSGAACVQILSPTAQCPANPTLTPQEIQPGIPFSVGSYVNYGDDRAANAARNGGSNYFVRVVRVTGGVETPVYNQELVPTSVSSGKLMGQTVTVPSTAVSVAGQYKVYWGNAGATGNKSCSYAFDAAYYPYFNVVGGDISAGAGFKNGLSCTTSTAAGIKGWNNGNGANYGAGTQLAALALGRIVDFATATNSSSGGSTAPTTTGNNGLMNNLTFSNASVSGQLGSAALPCMPDYYAGAYPVAQTSSALSVSMAGALTPSSGTYRFNNDLTIFGGTVPNDRNVTLLIDGDVYIATDILYAPYSDPRLIPRITIIAKGNIYVGSFVNELHGVFIAQGGGDATKGTFSTCANGLRNIIGTYANCNRQLTIYGAVAAERIKLQRTYGSLNASSGAPAAPAESFVYSPELWMSSDSSDVTDSAADPYDAITTLPPTL